MTAVLPRIEAVESHTLHVLDAKERRQLALKLTLATSSPHV